MRNRDSFTVAWFFAALWAASTFAALSPWQIFGLSDVHPAANVHTMVVVDLDTAPDVAANRLNALPPGSRVLNIRGYDQFLFADPGDLVPGENTHAYRGLWLDQGTATAKAKLDAFFKAIRAADGHIDFVVLDDEKGMSTWEILAGEDYQQYNQFAALTVDARWPTFAPKLSFTDYQSLIWPWNRAHVEEFNARAATQMAGYYNAAFQTTLAASFPDAWLCNYNNALIPQTVKQPDVNGWWVWGDGITGNVQSPMLYGQCGQIKDVLPDQHAEQPFHQVRLAINVLRACSYSAPVAPWVANREFNYGAVPWANSVWYDEMIRHAWLNRTTAMLYFNPKPYQRPQWEAGYTDAQWTAHSTEVSLAAVRDEVRNTVGDIGAILTPGQINPAAQVLVSAVGNKGGTRQWARVTFNPNAPDAVVVTVGNVRKTVNKPAGGPGVWVRIK